MELSSSDYKKIVTYYQIPKPTNKTYKQIAEDVLSSKLCKCIKSVRKDTDNEGRSIAICRKNIFRNRNIDFYKFKCDKHPRFSSTQSKTHRLKKTHPVIKFNKTKRYKKRM
jgi:hypothetical protein